MARPRPRERRAARLSAAIDGLGLGVGVVGGVALASLALGSWSSTASALGGVLQAPAPLLQTRLSRTASLSPAARRQVVAQRVVRVARHAEGDEDYLPWEEEEAEAEESGSTLVEKAAVQAIVEEPQDEPLTPADQAILAGFVAAARAAKEQDANLAGALQEEVQAKGADSAHLALALRALRLEGSPKSAIELFNSMGEQIPIKVNAFTELLYCHEAAGLGAQASDLLAAMKRRKVLPNRLCYNSLLRMHAKLRRYPQALGILDEMRKEGVLPTVTSYEIAMDAIPSKRHADIKLGLVRRMQAIGMKPDAGVYSQLIRACACSGQWKQAVEYFDEMRERGIKVDDTTTWFMLRACAQAPSWEIANTKFKEVEADPSITLTNIHYDVMINTCERAGRWAEIVSLASRMGAAGVSPLDITSNTVISACVNLRKWDVAVNLLRTMQQNGADLDAHAYSTVLGACAKAGQWQEVVGLYEDLRKQDDPKLLGEEVVRPAIAALVELGRVDDATALYQEASMQGWLRPWRRPRFGTGPALLEARDLSPQVAGIAVRTALMDATRKVDAAADPGHAKRCALAGFSGVEPQDIIVIVEEGSVESGSTEAEPQSAAESVIAAIRDVLGPEVQLQVRQEPYACIRVPAAELETLLVKHVQQAVSSFSSGGAQPVAQGAGEGSAGSI